MFELRPEHEDAVDRSQKSVEIVEVNCSDKEVCPIGRTSFTLKSMMMCQLNRDCRQHRQHTNEP